FGDKLEKACFTVLNQGFMTKDLANIAEEPDKVTVLNTEEFIDKIAENI
ncbi:MAG: NADP-dependent isocitrate dehydrogenase, partial [Lachnospiraceae bacterium]|nr:NADP-dependent isocitrate dehydrogenase [Lachnospiraceae bacterium]